MSDYNSSILSLINNYKNEIFTINDNYVKINEYINKYFKIVEDKVTNSRFKSTLINNAFFCKSSVLLLSKFENYIPSNYGKLIVNSGNCSFTIADIKKEQESSLKRMFIKVVDYRIQEGFAGDLLILDVMAYIIFDKILSLHGNEKYRHIIPKYEGCFLSYTKSNKWNYKDLLHTNIESPYLDLNITNNTSSYYNSKCIIVITEAINNPYSILQIFQEDNNILMKEVLLESCELYEFIKYIGVEYGFIHNDLHMGNVLYNPVIKKLVLIDFGRVSFCKYLKYYDEILNEKIMSDYKKLNYNNICETNSISINNYTDLYKNEEIYDNNLSIGDDGRYFGVIYDLITYSMNIYVKTIYYSQKVLNDIDYNKFIDNFSKIISVGFTLIDDLRSNKITILTTDTLDELITNFVDVRDNFINTIRCTNTKKHLTFLLEGLLYTSLLLHYKNHNSTPLNIMNNRILYSHFHVLIQELPQFKQYIEDNLRNYKSELSSDSFISLFISSSGGKNNDIKTMRTIRTIRNKIPIKNIENTKFSLFNIKSNSKIYSKPKELSLNDTVKAYTKLINIERKILE
jgi:hypothetical protein